MLSAYFFAQQLITICTLQQKNETDAEFLDESKYTDGYVQLPHEIVKYFRMEEFLVDAKTVD